MGHVRSFDLRRHWTRSVGRIGARNAKVTETFYDGLDLLDHPAIAVGDLAKVVDTGGEVLEARRIQYDGEDVLVTMLIGA